MRDIFFIGFMLLMFGLGFKRAYMGALCYIWIDLLQPQEQSYYLINTVPISMISALFAVLLFVVADRDKNVRVSSVQVLIILLVIWMTFTTSRAELPDYAWVKWDTAWKALGFAAFLPFVIRTRIQIETALFVVTFTILSIASSGAMKTLMGGGGYGQLSFLVDRNVGLFESSTIAAVSVGMIPIAQFLYNHNTLFEKDWRAKAVLAAVIGSAVLTVIGTEARTGLICLAVVGMFQWFRSKRKLMWVGVVLALGVAAIPFAPKSFTERMGTIETYDEDTSASTRLAMWGWTLNYVSQHPLGGGFGIWRNSQIEVEVKKRSGEGNNVSTTSAKQKDEARGFHSSYFEILGEQGFVGLGLFLGLFLVSLAKMRSLTKRYPPGSENEWIGAGAHAMFVFILVYMAGSAFQALSTQSTIYFVLCLGVSLSLLAVRLEDETQRNVVRDATAARTKRMARA